MSAEHWVAAGSIAAAFAALVTVFVLLKGVRDQLRMVGFIVYTDRYAKIMRGLPFDARRPGSDYSLATISEYERVAFLSAMREYLNLCAEELWLHKQRRIDRKTWKVWTNGMREVIRFPSFDEAWRILRPEYLYFEDFMRFMDELSAAGSGNNAGTQAASATQTNGPAKSQRPAHIEWDAEP